MKKTARLVLSRETLARLEAPLLARAAAGAGIQFQPTVTCPSLFCPTQVGICNLESRISNCPGCTDLPF